MDESICTSSAGESPQTEYCRPFIEALPIAGTAVSTIGDLLGTETVSASDAVAARLDELQFDLGEGPCWDALQLRRPVIEPDLRGQPQGMWPSFTPAAIEAGVGALFVFPLLVGPLRIGAVDMYAREPVALDEAHKQAATRLADSAGRDLLRRALGSIGQDEPDEEGNPYSRRIVHQATGMVLAQLNVSADDARMVIHAHAYTTDRSMMEVSRAVLDGRLDFSKLDQRGGRSQ